MLYDPMQDFYQKAIAFLFKQGFTAFLAVSFSALFWLKIEDVERQSRLDQMETRRNCSESISELRAELRDCRNEADKFRREGDTLRAENLLLHRRVTALELRLKNYVK